MGTLIQTISHVTMKQAELAIGTTDDHQRSDELTLVLHWSFETEVGSKSVNLLSNDCQ